MESTRSTTSETKITLIEKKYELTTNQKLAQLLVKIAQKNIADKNYTEALNNLNEAELCGYPEIYALQKKLAALILNESQNQQDTSVVWKGLKQDDQHHTWNTISKDRKIHLWKSISKEERQSLLKIVKYDEDTYHIAFIHPETSTLLSDDEQMEILSTSYETVTNLFALCETLNNNTDYKKVTQCFYMLKEIPKGYENFKPLLMKNNGNFYQSVEELSPLDFNQLKEEKEYPNRGMIQQALRLDYFQKLERAHPNDLTLASVLGDFYSEQNDVSSLETAKKYYKKITSPTGQKNVLDSSPTQIEQKKDAKSQYIFSVHYNLLNKLDRDQYRSKMTQEQQTLINNQHANSYTLKLAWKELIKQHKIDGFLRIPQNDMKRFLDATDYDDDLFNLIKDNHNHNNVTLFFNWLSSLAEEQYNPDVYHALAKWCILGYGTEKSTETALKWIGKIKNCDLTTSYCSTLKLITYEFNTLKTKPTQFDLYNTFEKQKNEGDLMSACKTLLMIQEKQKDVPSSMEKYTIPYSFLLSLNNDKNVTLKLLSNIVLKKINIKLSPRDVEDSLINGLIYFFGSIYKMKNPISAGEHFHHAANMKSAEGFWWRAICLIAQHDSDKIILPKITDLFLKAYHHDNQGIKQATLYELKKMYDKYPNENCIINALARCYEYDALKENTHDAYYTLSKKIIALNNSSLLNKATAALTKSFDMNPSPSSHDLIAKLSEIQNKYQEYKEEKRTENEYSLVCTFLANLKMFAAKTKEEHQLAFKQFQEAAELGNIAAQFMVAKSYCCGWYDGSLKLNFPLAISCYQEALNREENDNTYQNTRYLQDAASQLKNLQCFVDNNDDIKRLLAKTNSLSVRNKIENEFLAWVRKEENYKKTKKLYLLLSNYIKELKSIKQYDCQSIYNKAEYYLGFLAEKYYYFPTIEQTKLTKNLEETIQNTIKNVSISSVDAMKKLSEIRFFQRNRDSALFYAFSAYSMDTIVNKKNNVTLGSYLHPSLHNNNDLIIAYEKLYKKLTNSYLNIQDIWAELKNEELVQAALKKESSVINLSPHKEKKDDAQLAYGKMTHKESSTNYFLQCSIYEHIPSAPPAEPDCEILSSTSSLLSSFTNNSAVVELTSDTTNSDQAQQYPTLFHTSSTLSSTQNTKKYKIEKR